MSVELTDREHQIIQQLILDRWNPHRINKKIANHLAPGGGKNSNGVFSR